jgi:hypothetical protein
MALPALILACLPPAPCAIAGEDELAAARDLRREAAAAARRGQPLVLLFSGQQCPYCDEVRKRWLLPLHRETGTSRPMIRQIDQDGEHTLVDFQGKETTHARFAAAQKITFVPVVATYGPAGEVLAEPIVGLRLRDFYGAYLSAQLDEARARLLNRHPAPE